MRRQLLHEASVAGSIAQVDAYLRQPQASINDTLGDKWTALHHAVQHGHLDLFRYLITLPDIDLDAKTLAGTSPLALSICRHNLTMIEALVDAGARKDSIVCLYKDGSSRDRRIPSRLLHKLSPQWSPIWTPMLHRRLPRLQRKVIYTLLLVNNACHRRRSWREWLRKLDVLAIWPATPYLPPCSWRYLPLPILHLVFEFYAWID
ncbi:hypothetical protein H310_10164 [Aphanomyces invadans]|uniref:Uncharacterized protein n=1 Tax=Aphanomyces invadans TaxID=157072 RepID=A0A024TSB7_9STRA|nr:hypothetical protein H310_10164 [Aphanomyces invadans]ETV96888.1 hypothetical protein H310_10164 [Aphanomyces invadans]|eukprot:XP_008874665.1 hypothetical protein H310_10164 [Aphanomyces invadans]